MAEKDIDDKTEKGGPGWAVKEPQKRMPGSGQKETMQDSAEPAEEYTGIKPDNAEAKGSKYPAHDREPEPSLTPAEELKAAVRAAKISIGKKPEQLQKELVETLKRLQAEFENYRKNEEKRAQRATELANAALVRDILPVLDSLDEACRETTVCPPKDASCCREDEKAGLLCIRELLVSTLRAHGLMPIQAKGRVFDPYLDEVLQAVYSDLPEGTVIDELQKGYRLNSLVLRHARVRVSKGLSGKDADVGGKEDPAQQDLAQQEKKRDK